MGWDWFLCRKQTTRNPNPTKFSANTLSIAPYRNHVSVFISKQICPRKGSAVRKGLYPLYYCENDSTLIPSSFFFFSPFILQRMGKNQSSSSHTSTPKVGSDPFVARIFVVFIMYTCVENTKKKSLSNASFKLSRLATPKKKTEYEAVKPSRYNSSQA